MPIPEARAQLAEIGMELEATSPTMTQQAIGEAFGVNAGRVSEALQGLR
jgi:hypothetical protein